MGQKEKLIEKLLSKPRNFTFNEAETLLGYFSYCRSNKGKTSGSRVMLRQKIFLRSYCTNRIHAKNCLSIR